MITPSSPPIALTIAGSDSSAGAGLQADLKTFQHFRVMGLTAVTCVVSETPLVVRHVHPVPLEVVLDQVQLLLSSYPVAAVKTGMLYSAAVIAGVADIFVEYPGIVLVVDPVMIASTGTPLIEPAAIAAYQDLLLPRATLMTPNLPEAECLLGKKITVANLEASALELRDRYSCGVLLKGGHLDGAECADVLATQSGMMHFTAQRIATAASHGTGCTLSAAITANLASGKSLEDACASAKHFIGEALAKSLQWTSADGGNIAMLNQGTTF